MPSENLTSADQGDVLELLKRDHLRVDQLLDEIEATEDTDEARRAQLFAQIAAEIEVHSDSEDQAVYGALEARGGFEDLVEDARGEHEHIEQMIEELDQTEVTSPEWRGKVRELRQLVRHHVDEEEGRLFAMMRERLDANELIRLGHEFVAARDSEEDEVTGERSIAGGSGSNGERDIESLSKKELYELARTRHIEGRSGMTKAELVIAIRAAR